MTESKLLQGDALEVLRTLSNESVDCCITSPPYQWGLRNYNVDGQLGLEKTPEEYVAKMVEVFREVRRVLKDEGTLFLNIGDSYMSGGGASRHWGYTDPKYKDGRKVEHFEPTAFPHPTIKPKDLVGIPWRVAFALQADGWYLRQDIIWAKPNPMPESVTDRCTKSHEYIFLIAKNQKYYFDNEAIKEKASSTDSSNRNRDITKLNNTPGRTKMAGLKTNHYTTKNKRSIWTVATKPYRGAHFATFPEDLILPCVLAGCSIGGVILDPFLGSGTTGIVAKKNNRNFIGIDLNPEYITIAKKRIENTQESML